MCVCVCVCVCVSECACCDLIDHDTLSLWCGHLHSARSLSLRLYLRVSPSISLSPLLLPLHHLHHLLLLLLFSHQAPCTFLHWSHLLNLTLPSFLTFFYPEPPKSVFRRSRGCSLSRSLSSALPCLFFFLNPFHFRAEILQSFTCLLDSSLPDFLLCFAPPCSTDL